MTHAIRIHPFGSPEVVQWNEIKPMAPGNGVTRIAPGNRITCADGMISPQRDREARYTSDSTIPRA